MDELDFRIFKSLDFQPYGDTAGDLSRLNPWVIARKLGVDGNTVKQRLNRMKKSGFIQYFQIYPNFRLLGLQGASYEFEVPDILQKAEVIDRCALVDGVIEIHNFIGPTICVDFAYADARDELRRLELFRKLTRCDVPEKFYERTMPPVDIGLTALDWRIVKALRYQAFRPLSQVAEELGLSAKTVRRRFDRMANGRAILVAPFVNPASVPDTITHVLLLYPEPARREEVLATSLEIFGPACFLAKTAPPGNAMVCLTARTLAETEENLIRARRIDGMVNAKLLVLREIREFTEWLDTAIDRAIDGSVSSPGPGSVGH
jgi:DNA-binding Lrp family transcriptional regulator